MSKNTGGPAFPFFDERGVLYRGATLRDYFAAKAMQALVSLDPTNAKQLSNPDNRNYGDWIASDAYKIADAMLAEREDQS